MTSAIETSGKETWQLALFVNKRTSVVLAAYTDSDSDQVFGGQLYTSTPELEIKLPKNTGMVDPAPCNFILPIADTFTRALTDGILTNPRVRVTVHEIIKAHNTTATNLTTFTGEVVGASKNFQGRRDTLALSALSPKAMLDTIAIGIPCNHHCGNALGDRYCGISFSPGERTKTPSIAAIDGKKITVSTGHIADGNEDRFYAKGFMDYDGVRVMVQEWRNEVEGDKHDFFMQERVPDEWLGKVVTLFSGCDKSIETCRTRYSNESQFNGRGHAMPQYHPLFEDGGSRQ